MIWVRESITKMVKNGRSMINYGQVENKFPNLMYCRTNSAIYGAPQKFKWNYTYTYTYTLCVTIFFLYSLPNTRISPVQIFHLQVA